MSTNCQSNTKKVESIDMQYVWCFMDMEKIQDLIYTNGVYCTCIRHESYVIGSGYFHVYLSRFNHGQATISKTAQECIDIIMIFITRLQSNIASFCYIKFLFKFQFKIVRLARNTYYRMNIYTLIHNNNIPTTYL